MRHVVRADAAVMNGGGIRAGKIYPVGSSITRRDVLAELPFNNRVLAVEMSGRDLRSAIENGLSQLPNASGRFPQVAGMRIEAEIGRPAGSRVVAIEVGGAPLDDARTYRVATNDFIGRGGDGYNTFRTAHRLIPDEDAPLLANAVMTHIRDIAPVRTNVEGRITLR
jgi:2',3'-cyclic-nucleotide 2'-phosphodiesterase (5'-nucleotidase family)